MSSDIGRVLSSEKVRRTNSLWMLSKAQRSLEALIFFASGNFSHFRNVSRRSRLSHLHKGLHRRHDDARRGVEGRWPVGPLFGLSLFFSRGRNAIVIEFWFIYSQLMDELRCFLWQVFLTSLGAALEFSAIVVWSAWDTDDILKILLGTWNV